MTKNLDQNRKYREEAWKIYENLEDFPFGGEGHDGEEQESLMSQLTEYTEMVVVTLGISGGGPTTWFDVGIDGDGDVRWAEYNYVLSDVHVNEKVPYGSGLLLAIEEACQATSNWIKKLNKGRL